jgi:hypothetical protein
VVNKPQTFPEMKKLSLILTALLVTILFMNGCSESAKHSETPPAEHVKEEYQCPMKCNDAKYDKPGTCTVCGMELEKITNG